MALVTLGSKFQRAIAVLVSGNIAAIALPLLAAPILGRIYPPLEYASLAEYMAIMSILAVLATMQFQHAIIAEKSHKAALQIVRLCLFLSIAIGIVSLFGMLIGWSIGFFNAATNKWFWLLPFSLGVSGLVAGGGSLANRLGSFGWMASLPVMQAAITVSLSIALGLIGWGSDGLLTAYFAGQTVQLLAYVYYLQRVGFWRKRLNLKILLLYAKRHWRYLAYSLPSEFSSQINMQVPVFALSIINANSALGEFTKARQLVSMPVTLLGGAVANVFRRDASILYRKTGSCRSFLLKTGIGLFMIGLIPCFIFMWVAPSLFTFYLGSDWSEAGNLARILAPMLLFRLVASPLSSVFFFNGHQKLDLKLMLMSSFLMIFCICVAFSIFRSAVSIIISYSVAYIVIYILYFLFSWLTASSLRVGEK